MGYCKLAENIEGNGYRESKKLVRWIGIQDLINLIPCLLLKHIKNDESVKRVCLPQALCSVQVGEILLATCVCAFSIYTCYHY